MSRYKHKEWFGNNVEEEERRKEGRKEGRKHKRRKCGVYLTMKNGAGM